ncbi:thioredoxin family protein [Pseudoclavibacter soli]|uniref:thioredoxin family protein n=1 Tax=Pseudoclavibacter soli TaxID=452623 RepID=UPI000404B1D4|nr:thioredoxin family protein [Pseudoclavibacter soli]
MNLLPALAIVIGIVLVATVLGVWQQRRSGRVVAQSGEPTDAPADSQPKLASIVGEFGALGQRATFVQFSTEYCANCPSVRRSLSAISDEHADIEFIEIDVGQRLDIAKQADVMKTPTVLVLDGGGHSVARIVGPPKRADLAQLVATL